MRAGGLPALLPLLIVPPGAASETDTGLDGDAAAVSLDGGAGATTAAAAPARAAAGGGNESDFMGDTNLRFSVSQVRGTSACLISLTV